MKKAALAKPCYASQHLTPAEWGVLEVCLRLTLGGKNRLFLDGRSLANRFDQTGKATVYRIVKELERKGWLVRVDGGKRNQQTGMYDSTKYRVLSHQEWTKLDGNTCPGSERPCPIDAKNPSPVPKSGLDLSRNVKPPVPEPGHTSDRTFRLEPSENKKQWSADADLLFLDFPRNRNSSLPTDSTGESLPSKPNAEPESSRKARPVLPHQDFVLLRSAVLGHGVNVYEEWTDEQIAGAIAKSWVLAGEDTERLLDLFETVAVEKEKTFTPDFFNAVWSYLETYG
jgi:hypothetical protein